jgi:hypothetical protein
VTSSWRACSRRGPYASLDTSGINKLHLRPNTSEVPLRERLLWNAEVEHAIGPIHLRLVVAANLQQEAPLCFGLLLQLSQPLVQFPSAVKKHLNGRFKRIWNAVCLQVAGGERRALKDKRMSGPWT